MTTGQLISEAELSELVGDVHALHTTVNARHASIVDALKLSYEALISQSQSQLSAAPSSEELVSLRQQNRDLLLKNSELSQQNIALHNQVSSLRDQLQLLEARLERERADASDALSRLQETHRVEIAGLVSENKREVESVRSQLQSEIQKREIYQKSQDDLLERLNEVLKQERWSVESAESLKRVNMMLERENERLKQAVADARATAAASERPDRDQYVHDLEERLASVLDEIEAKAPYMESVLAEMNALKESSSALQQSNAGLRKDLAYSESVVHVKDAEIESLQRTIGDVRRQVTHLLHTQPSSTTDLTFDTIDELVQKNQMLIRRCHEFRVAAEQSYAAAVKKVEADFAAKISSYEEMIAHMRNERQRIQASVELLMTKKEQPKQGSSVDANASLSTSANSATAVKEVRVVDPQLEKELAFYRDEELPSLRSQISSLHNERSVMMGMMQSLQAQVRQLQEFLAQTEAKYRDALVQSRILETSYATMKESYAKQEERVEEMSKKNSSLISYIESAKDAATREQAALFRAKIMTLENDVATLHADLEAERSRCVSLSDKYDIDTRQLRQELQSLVSQNQEDMLRQRIALLERELEESRSSGTHCQNVIEALESELRNTKAESAHFRARYEELVHVQQRVTELEKANAESSARLQALANVDNKLTEEKIAHGESLRSLMSLTADNTDLRSRLSALQDRCSLLEVDLKSATEKSTALQLEISSSTIEFQRALSDRETQIEKLLVQLEIAHLAPQTSGQSASVSGLSASGTDPLSGFVETIHMLRRDKAIEQEKRMSLENEMLISKNKLETLQRRNAELHTQLEAAVSMSKSGSDAERLRDATRELEVLRVSVDKFRAERDALSAELLGIQGRMRALVANDDAHQHLDSELRSARAELQTAQSRIADLERINSVYEDELKASKERPAQQLEVIRKLEADIAQAEEKFNTMKRKAQEALKKQHENNTSLQSQVSALQGQVTSLQSQVSALEAEKQAFLQQISHLQSQLASAATAAAVTSLPSSSPPPAVTVNHESESEVRLVERQASKPETAEAEAQTALAYKAFEKAVYEKARERYAGLADKLAAETARAKSLEDENAALQLRVAELLSEIAVLQKNLASATTAPALPTSSDNLAEVSKLTERISELESQLEEIDIGHFMRQEKLQKKLDEKELELESLRNQLSSRGKRERDEYDDTSLDAGGKRVKTEDEQQRLAQRAARFGHDHQ
jgi:nucleoprotein TPR